MLEDTTVRPVATEARKIWELHGLDRPEWAYILIFNPTMWWIELEQQENWLWE